MRRNDHWSERAACKGMNNSIFFPDVNVGENIEYQKLLATAKEICATCLVTEQCLELTSVVEEYDDRWGVFGGLDPKERRKLRARQRKQESN
jgi:WhiB family redox-sensing transcriptional regulator